jgi:hypothetical protein
MEQARAPGFALQKSTELENRTSEAALTKASGAPIRDGVDVLQDFLITSAPPQFGVSFPC